MMPITPAVGSISEDNAYITFEWLYDTLVLYIVRGLRYLECLEWIRLVMKHPTRNDKVILPGP